MLVVVGKIRMQLLEQALSKCITCFINLEKRSIYSMHSELRLETRFADKESHKCNTSIII